MAQRLFEFNFCPSGYIHPSRRKQFDDGKLHPSVWETTRALPALSRHILKCLDIENKACFDLGFVQWPLLLMQPQQLTRLQRHLAAVIFNPIIRRCVLHDEVVMWRNRLGADAYKFALNGFEFLPRKLWPHTDFDVSQLEAISYGLIQAAMTPVMRPARLRAVLKLPTISEPSSFDPDCAQKLVTTLMSILEPEWRSYFPRIQH
nr:SctK family type III secretion system sorting platform protein [uncultured Noviherbaspirillum sp.]